MIAGLPAPARERVPTDSLVPNPRNDNIHPQEQIDKLREGIKKFGQPRPVLVRAENRMLIAGHGVHMAMLQEGEPEIDTLMWNVDQETADAYLVADNRFSELSRSDPKKRRDLMIGFAEEDWPALGFGPDDVEALLDEAERTAPPLAVREVETSEVEDVFWISITGPLDQQAFALQKLHQVMGELPGVEVTLGTTRSGGIL